MTDPVSNKLTRRERAQYTLTLGTLTNEQLFETWSHEYDARHAEHVELILVEMDHRKLGGGAIDL